MIPPAAVCLKPEFRRLPDDADADEDDQATTASKKRQSRREADEQVWIVSTDDAEQIENWIEAHEDDDDDDGAQSEQSTGSQLSSSSGRTSLGNCSDSASNSSCNTLKLSPSDASSIASGLTSAVSAAGVKLAAGSQGLVASSRRSVRGALRMSRVFHLEDNDEEEGDAPVDLGEQLIELNSSDMPSSPIDYDGLESVDDGLGSFALLPSTSEVDFSKDYLLPARVVTWMTPRVEEPTKGKRLFFNYHEVVNDQFPKIETPVRLIVQSVKHGRHRVVALNPHNPLLCLPIAETGASGKRAITQVRRILEWLAVAVEDDPVLNDPGVNAYQTLMRGHEFTVSSSAGANATPRQRCAMFEDMITGDNESPSTAEMQEALAKFIVWAWGRTNLLKRLGEKGREVYPKLCELIFKTNARSLERFRRSTALCFSNWTNYQQGRMPTQRLPREDLRLIESTIKLRSLLQRMLTVLRPLNNSSELTTAINEAVELVQPLLDLILSATAWRDECLAALSAELGLQTGDLIGYPFENDRYYRSCRRSTCSRAFFTVWFGSAVGHVSLAIRQTDDNNREHLTETHMWGNPSKHSLSRFTLGTLGNIFFSPRPEVMISNPRYLELIAQAFPEEPSAASAVRKVFHLALLQWHEENDEFLQRARNDAKYRYVVGLVFNTVSARPATWRERADFNWGRGKPDHQVSCSEFAIRCWLQALDLCGRIMASRINELDPALRIPLDGSTIFRDDLISGYRRVMRYSPGQLTFRLRRSRFAQELELPSWHVLFS